MEADEELEMARMVYGDEEVTATPCLHASCAGETSDAVDARMWVSSSLAERPYVCAEICVCLNRATYGRLSVRQSRGLDGHACLELEEATKQMCGETLSIGEPVLLQALQAASDALDDLDVPEPRCGICLAKIHPSTASEHHTPAVQTKCRHCFHTTCLRRYLDAVRADPHVEETAEDFQRLRRHYATDEDIREALIEEARARPAHCPECRDATVTMDLFSADELAHELPPYSEDEDPDSQDEDDLSHFSLSDNARREQEERRRLFQYQLGKSAIIDLSRKEEMQAALVLDHTPSEAASRVPTPKEITNARHHEDSKQSEQRSQQRHRKPRGRAARK